MIITNVFDYATGAIFTVGTTIYLYLLITKSKSKSKDSDPELDSEEKAWIYFFLSILIIGFFYSYFTVISKCY